MNRNRRRAALKGATAARAPASASAASVFSPAASIVASSPPPPPPPPPAFPAGPKIYVAFSYILANGGATGTGHIVLMLPDLETAERIQQADGAIKAAREAVFITILNWWPLAA